MIYYLDSRSTPIEEFLASNGTYIGVLGTNSENCIKPTDIALDKINEHYANGEFLICCPIVGNWCTALVFNNLDGANEVKKKYKGKVMLWYWLKRKHIDFCLRHMHKKSFDKEFL